MSDLLSIGSAPSPGVNYRPYDAVLVQPPGHAETRAVRNPHYTPPPTGPTPPPVAGYTAWWDATTITGVADAALLSSWPDSSPNGYNLAQATGAKQPTYYQTTPGKLINGKPAVWFDGGRSMNTTALPIQPTPYTIGWVAQATVLNLSNTFIWCGSNNVGVQVESGAPANYLIFGGTNNNSPAGVVPDTSLHAAAAAFDTGSGGVMYQDATVATGQTWGGSPPGSSPFRMCGTNPNDQGGIVGAICEMWVWPKKLSSPEWASIRSYCQAKWGTP